MGSTWGPPGCCRPQMAPCWPHKPCYQGTGAFSRRKIFLFWLKFQFISFFLGQFSCSQNYIAWRQTSAKPLPTLKRTPQIIRLIHSPSWVAIGLSVGYETRPPIGWHHPFVIGWSKDRLGLPSAPLHYGLTWPVGIPTVFQTPVTVPLHCNCLLLGLCKGTVKEYIRSLNHLGIASFGLKCFVKGVSKWNSLMTQTYNFPYNKYFQIPRVKLPL